MAMLVATPPISSAYTVQESKAGNAAAMRQLWPKRSYLDIIEFRHDLSAQWYYWSRMKYL